MDTRYDNTTSYERNYNRTYMVPPPPIQRFSKKSIKPQWSNKKVTKYKYNAPDGKKLAAGGILFFEQTTSGKGIWVVEEDEISSFVYTDFGGKYDHNDGDIFATISREFREETCNTREILYRDIKNLPPVHHVYIDGYDGKPVYLCVVVHMNHFNMTFDSKEIKTEREKIIETNPTIPEKWYRTNDVKFLLLKDISKGKYQLSKRLTAILKSLSTDKGLYTKEIEEFFCDLAI